MPHPTTVSRPTMCAVCLIDFWIRAYKTRSPAAWELRRERVQGHPFKPTSRACLSGIGSLRRAEQDRYFNLSLFYISFAATLLCDLGLESSSGGLPPLSRHFSCCFLVVKVVSPPRSADRPLTPLALRTAAYVRRVSSPPFRLRPPVYSQRRLEA
jgi:hypothetical protein